jgi:hypothetical protein
VLERTRLERKERDVGMEKQRRMRCCGDIYPDAGSVVHGTARRGSVRDCVSHATNGESTGVRSSTGSRSSPLKSGSRVKPAPSSLVQSPGGEFCSPLLSPRPQASRKHRQRAKPRTSPLRTFLAHTKTRPAAPPQDPDCTRRQPHGTWHVRFERARHRTCLD